MTLSAKQLEDYRLKIEGEIIPTGYLQFEFLLDDPDDPTAVSFRAFNAIGERLFATNFPKENWSTFVELVNRFNEKYKIHIS